MEVIKGAKNGTAFSFVIPLISVSGSPNYQDSPTLAAGDVKVVRYTSSAWNVSNITSLPTAVTGMTTHLEVSLTAGEMTADDDTLPILVVFKDAAGGEWVDQTVAIRLGAMEADVTNINGGATDGYNATLKLSRLDIQSQTTDTPAVNLVGNGTGAGLLSTGGSSDGVGIFAQGTASGAACRMNGGVSGYGLFCQGHDIISAARFVGDAGVEVRFADSVNGAFYCKGAFNLPGALIEGNGTAEGLSITGGATAAGVVVAGGATSGAGVSVTTTNGAGISVAPGGNNVAATLQGAGTGSALQLIGGGSSGTGLDIYGNGQSPVIGKGDAIRAFGDNFGYGADINGAVKGVRISTGLELNGTDGVPALKITVPSSEGTPTANALEIDAYDGHAVSLAGGTNGAGLYSRGAGTGKDIDAPDSDIGIDISSLATQASVDTIDTNVDTILSGLTVVDSNVDTIVSKLPSGIISDLSFDDTVDGKRFDYILELVMAMVNGRFLVDTPTTGQITFYKRDNSTVLTIVDVNTLGRTRIS